MSTKKSKISVIATGIVIPSTDCPNAKEFEVFLGGEKRGKHLGYIVANTKKGALEEAHNLALWYRY